MEGINDLFTRIRNAVLVKKSEVVLPYSRIKLDIANVLVKKSFLENIHKDDVNLVLKIAYQQNAVCRISGIKVIYRPGVHTYKKANDLKSKNRFAITIISTSKGVMTGKEAEKLGIGGEVLAEVW